MEQSSSYLQNGQSQVKIQSGSQVNHKSSKQQVEQLQSPQKQPNSESDQMYESKQKKKKTRKKKKKKQKNQFDQKLKSRESYLLKKAVDLQKASKDCQKLNSFFATKVQAKLQPKDRSFTQYKYNLYDEQAEYLTKNYFPQQYSLQQDEIKVKQQPAQNKSKLQLKQYKLDVFLQPIPKIKEQLKPQQIKEYSESYYFIKSYLQEMLQLTEIPQFFKREIDKIMQREPAYRYYYQYKQIIKNPLSITTLLQMIQDGRIKNYIQFKMNFGQMILNSKYFHFLKNNQHMIERGERLKELLEDKFCTQLHPQGNQLEEDLIKTIQSKRPKSTFVKQQQQSQSIKYMDLDNEHNMYRFSVMNKFLKIVCFKHPQKVQMLIARLENIITRYPNDIVLLVKRDQGQQQKKSVSQQQIKPNFLKQKQYVPKSPKSPISQRSSRSDNTSQSQLIYYQVVPQQIQPDLFQQMKKLIAAQVQQRRRSLIRDIEQPEQIRRVLFPHEDSEDFDIDDDSYES